MKQKLLRIIFAMAVFSFMICGYAEGVQASQTGSLKIHMAQGRGKEAFRQLYPQVTVEYAPHLTKEDVFTIVLTQSADIDMFGSNTNNLPTYRELISRGFYAPIESEKLRRFAESCYPGVREALFVGDQLVGVPVWCIQVFQPGVEMDLWRELGLDEGALPRTWMRLIDFIQNQWPALAAGREGWRVITREDYELLFYEILTDYEVYRRRQPEDPGYDTQIFRETMAAYLSMPLEDFEEEEDGTKALFSANLSLSPEAEDYYRETHYDSLRLGFTGEAEKKALLTLGLMVVNPYSPNRALCEAYLECMVDSMDPIERAILDASFDQPVHWEGWEEFKAEFEAEAEDYRRRIEATSDPAAKQALQLELEEHIEMNATLYQHPWLISAESLARYRADVQDQIISWDDALNEREWELFDALCDRVHARTAPVDVIVNQLNRIYYYRDREDA